MFLTIFVFFAGRPAGCAATLSVRKPTLKRHGLLVLELRPTCLGKQCFIKFLGRQCFRSQCLCTYRFCVDWEAVQACPKKTFWILKIVFLQSLSFLQVIGENNVSGSQVYPHIDLEWMGSSPSMPDKNNFLELGNCFSAKPKFSSSFLGKTMFQVPKSIHI